MIFRGFPASPDRTTDFEGFATVLSIICRGTIEVKSHWLYGVMDSDSKGGISYGDLTDSFRIIVSFIQSITGRYELQSLDIAKQRASGVFSLLQRSHGEMLTSEDFLSWIRQNEEVVDNLNIILTKV